jgi:hypothetical protein
MLLMTKISVIFCRGRVSTWRVKSKGVFRSVDHGYSGTGHDRKLATTFNKSCSFISPRLDFLPKLLYVILYEIRIIMLIFKVFKIASIIGTINYSSFYIYCECQRAQGGISFVCLFVHSSTRFCNVIH